MKKYLFTLGVILFFNSCSTNDDLVLSEEAKLNRRESLQLIDDLTDGGGSSKTKFKTPPYNSLNTMFFYNNDSSADIFKLNSDGTIGNRLYRAASFSDDWTIIERYEVNGKPFILFYSKRRGDAAIYNIDSNTGKILGLVQNYTGWRGGRFVWNEYWERIQSYKIGGTSYMFFYSDEGAVEIYKINSNGILGERVYLASWSDDFTSVKVYDVNNKHYVLVYNTKKSSLDIYNIDSNTGKVVGLVKKYSTKGGIFKFNEAWDIIETYKIGTITYMLLYSDDGNVEVYKVNSDGTLGQRVYLATWSNDISSLKIYEINNNPFILVYRRGESKGDIYNIDPNTGKVIGLVKGYTGWRKKIID